MSQIQASNIPKLCMKRDKQAIDFVKDYARNAECSAIVGMIEMGKEVIYAHLLEDLEQEHLPFILRPLVATSPDELKTFLSEIKKEDKPLLCVIHLSVGEDVSWFVKELQDIREKKQGNFITILLSSIGDVYTSLIDMDKILVKSLFVLSPIHKDDAITLLQDFEKRFNYTLTDKEKEDVYTWSFGHVGTLKSLYLLKREGIVSLFNAESLINDKSILYRIHTLVNDLPEEARKYLVNPFSSFPIKSLLETFGFLHNGKLTNELLKEYLNKRATTFSQIALFLSRDEAKLFDYLQHHINTIVTRETISQTLWQDIWEEKYSDWAIDQTIHRIREKLKMTHSPYEIVTKKGEGFYLKTL